MKKTKTGFTVAELLIVVAIIAVLVAISIPIFTSQLEKSREATDLANVRSAYAAVMTAALTEDASATYSPTGEPIWQEDSGIYLACVSLKQKQAGWNTKASSLIVAGISHDTDMGNTWIGDPSGNEGSVCEVYYDPAKESVVLKWDGQATVASDDASILAYLNLPQLRESSNWSFSGGLLAYGNSTNRASLTLAPIKLDQGATIEISAEDGYDAAYWIMHYQEGVGFVADVDGKWINSSKGIKTYTSTNDNTYILINTRKSDNSTITGSEAQTHTSLKITGNSSVSTKGMSGTTLTGAISGTIRNTINGKTGGTIYSEANGKRAYTSVSNVSAGSVLYITGNSSYKTAYYFTKSDGTVLYDSGWISAGTSTAVFVPEDCTVQVQIEGNSTLTSQQREEAISCFTLYTK